MQRAELEHLIRAVSAITNQYELVIIGSQSILGSAPNAPAELLQSMEADFYPKAAPELADLIDGSVGELSPFHTTFGYYAQGVGPETALLPEGWEQRLVKIQNDNTDLKVGLCLEPHDLAASKLAARREKDFPFVRVMLEHGLIDSAVVQERVGLLPIDAKAKADLLAFVASVSPNRPGSPS
jgi:hypothetical protein